MKPKKLIQKSQKKYLVFAIIVLVVITPLFYIISEKFYLDDVEESLHKSKLYFETNYLLTLKQTEISNWNKFHVDIKILPYSALNTDSIFTILYFIEEEQEYEPYRELRTNIFIEKEPYTLSIRNSLLESEDLIVSIGLLVFTITLILLVGLYFITKKQSFKLWKPFYDTLKQIESYELDKLKIPHLPKSDVIEFNKLTSKLTDLMQRNQVIFQHQKEFIENAAHELQTPIAVFRAKLDSLIQYSELTDQQAEIINSLNETVGRLSRLNKNLLLLSKLENIEHTTKEIIQLNDLISQKLTFLKVQGSQKKIDIETSFEEELLVDSDQELLDILLNNLFLNTIQHNAENGTVMIHILKGKLEVSNSGENKPLSEDHIFKRFSKTDSSTKGTGLGLAIISRICNINNWKISYSFDNSLHCFTLIFD